MAVIARRLSILTLTLAIFALMFSALVARPGHRGTHLQSSLSASCDPLQPCRVAL